MKIACLILFFFLFCEVHVFSQSDVSVLFDEKPMKQKEQALYIELLGNSITGLSLNYDRIIKYCNNSSFLNVTAGIGIGYNNSFNFPFSTNYSVSMFSPNHYIEFGLGMGVHFFEDFRKRNTRILVTSRLGYKYQRPKGGFYLRAGLTPAAPLFYFEDNDYHDTLFRTKTKSPDGWNLFEDFDLLFSSVSLCIGYSF